MMFVSIHHQWLQVWFAGVFFLTGLIWARTVFCIDMGNIVYRNMVKIHLPHMYMIFVECYRKQILCSTDLQYCTKLFNTFRIRSALSSLSLQNLWVRCSFFRNTSFFSGFDRGASRVFRSLTRILYATSSSLFHGQ